MIIGILIITWSIIQQINYPEKVIYSTLTTIFCSSFFFSLPYIIKYFFNQPNLNLELEKYRDELIQIYSTHAFSQAPRENEPKRFNIITTLEREQEGERSKYLRIKLENNGRKTAENCRIKMHILKPWDEIVHEASYIFPSGYHQAKKNRELPPAINIAPKDSQIYDICSSNNLWENDKLIRFEDYFTYSTVQGQEDLNLLKNYRIKLFVYSDNNPAFEKQYCVYKNNKIEGIDWEKLDIKEFEWKKQSEKKLAKFREILNKRILKLKKEAKAKNVEKSNQTTAIKVKMNSSTIRSSYPSGKVNQQQPIDNRQRKKNDYTTGYFVED